MGEASLTAKIIPATRRFPEPALALPVYDNNGKSAGLALVSLVSSPEGRLTQGDTRMVMTERAQGAVLQRSRSGNTIVVSDLPAALDAVRTHPEDGVVWQTGDELPSGHLLRVTGGVQREAEAAVTANILMKENEIALPEKDSIPESATSPDIKGLLEKDAAGRQEEAAWISMVIRQENEPRETPENISLPVEDVLRIRPDMLTPNEDAGLLTPETALLRRVASRDASAASDAGRQLSREQRPDADHSSRERRSASGIVKDLANSERDIVRQPENRDHGRMPEQDEQTLHRTIQKER